MHRLENSQLFIGVTVALFLGSAALTIAQCASMPATYGTPMCSVRTTTLPIAAAEFLAMWVTMMTAMMLPSLMPMLWRYRRAVATTRHLDALTGCVGLGYFAVWSVLGIFAFAAQSFVSDMTLRWPMVAGCIVVITGALQFSDWKARHLKCCRAERPCCERLPADFSTAWRCGIRLGVHCAHCCIGLTLSLLAIGLMDVRAMALVTAAISVERLAPDGLRAARFIGGILLVIGAWMITRAMV